MKACLHLL